MACGLCVAGAAEPPAMPQRAIAPDSAPLPGKKTSLREGDLAFTLFVPAAWKASNNTVTIHFHTADWFVIQEHLRRGASHPLATFYLGEGSTVYRRPFEDPKRFGRVLNVIESHLGTKARQLEISSFSAGYGAVREILKQPEYFDRITAIVLADSMYAALETNSIRRPLAEHIAVWAPFARAAMAGQKTFVITHSAVPTSTYASSGECAQALLALLKVRDEPVQGDQGQDFPLLRRADAGNFHVWSYGGTNAQAHMTHPRHAADIWKAVGR